MFADDMAQYWAIYQTDLRKPASAPMFNNPIAVLSIESDAKHLVEYLSDRYGGRDSSHHGLTYILTSHEDGREDYSEVY